MGVLQPAQHGHREPPRPTEGIYLRMHGRIGQILVCTLEGVFRCRSARPRPEAEKWSALEARAIRGTPWNPSGGRGGDEVEVIPRSDEAPPDHDQAAEDRPTVRRRFKIARWMLHEFRWSSPCTGCESRRKRIGSYLHSEACRKRIEAELAQTHRGRTILQRSRARTEQGDTESDSDDGATAQATTVGGGRGEPPTVC